MTTTLVDELLTLLDLPTGVPAGAVEPDAEAVAAAIERTVVPMLEARHPDEVLVHHDGDVAARFGPHGPDGLVLLTYVVAQHGDPTAPPATTGHDTDGEAIVIGRGAAQVKGAMASALAALDLVLDDRHDLERPVWLCVNTEGSSSHGGSARLLDNLGVTGAAGVVLAGTDLAISRANRGRVDITIDIDGQTCHSSQPSLGDNPFDRLDDVLVAVAGSPRPPAHPELGPATTTPFRVEAHPIAPHTVPGRLRLVVDRRLLPGEDPDAVVAGVRQAVGHLRGVEVRAGAWMLPASVPADAPIVEALRRGVATTGRAASVVVSHHTFDAGLANARGIPTPMFGPGRRSFAGDMTASEHVSVADCVDAATALAATIRQVCAGR